MDKPRLAKNQACDGKFLKSQILRTYVGVVRLCLLGAVSRLSRALTVDHEQTTPHETPHAHCTFWEEKRQTHFKGQPPLMSFILHAPKRPESKQNKWGKVTWSSCSRCPHESALCQNTQQASTAGRRRRASTRSAGKSFGCRKSQRGSRMACPAPEW